MKKASIIAKLLYTTLILLLIGIVYLQYKNYQKTLLKKEQEISSLKNKIDRYKKQLDKPKKAVQKIHKIEPKIPKDATVIKLPEVPKVTAKVPKVVTVGGTKIKDDEEKTLSMEIPVEKEEVKKSDQNQTQKEIKLVGVEHLGRVSTYLQTAYISPKDVKERLKKEGFKIIGEEKLKNEVVSIVFTNETLKELATKSPFIASLRVLVNKNTNQVAIQNPIYFAKAFLQDSFDEEKTKKVLKSLNKAFDDLKNSSDKLKYSLLANYQFMFGMPYYKDMITIKKDKSTDKIISKIPKQNIVFMQKISEHRFLLGIKLPQKSEKFINIIGDKNAFLLPYPLLVENAEAKILNPKYYIAISYPMLKMSQFMKISSIPDEIESDFKRIVK